MIRGNTPGLLPRDARDHKAWLEHWGTQLLDAIADAVKHPEDSQREDDFRLRYVDSCTRIAYSRAMKVKPRLKIRA